VAHTYNPSYSGGRDQEDRGWKAAWANSSERPYLKNPFTKIGLVEWLKVKAPYLKKKKERMTCGWKVNGCNWRVSQTQIDKVFSHTWKIDSKNKHIHKNKHDHIQTRM
jgi:hypothetical protein